MSNLIESVKAFRDKDHFSAKAWEERGLIPSPGPVVARLKTWLHQVANSLIQGLETNPDTELLRPLFVKALSDFEKEYADTEETEFACELLYDLANSINLNISFELNSFIYGPTLATAIRDQQK